MTPCKLSVYEQCTAMLNKTRSEMKLYARMSVKLYFTRVVSLNVKALTRLS